MPDLWGRLVGKRLAPRASCRPPSGDEGLHASLYLFVVDMDMDPRPGYAMTELGGRVPRLPDGPRSRALCV